MAIEDMHTIQKQYKISFGWRTDCWIYSWCSLFI